MAEMVTINHDRIREWIESHGGKPAIIDDPEAGADKIGIRINFPGKDDEAFLTRSHQSKDITWQRFFNIFEKQQLAFIIEDPPEDMNLTQIYRFIPRQTVSKNIKWMK